MQSTRNVCLGVYAVACVAPTLTTTRLRSFVMFAVRAVIGHRSDAMLQILEAGRAIRAPAGAYFEGV